VTHNGEDHRVATPDGVARPRDSLIGVSEFRCDAGQGPWSAFTMVRQRAQLRQHRAGAREVARAVERLGVPREWVGCAPAEGEERLTRREAARPVAAAA